MYNVLLVFWPPVFYRTTVFAYILPDCRSAVINMSLVRYYRSGTKTWLKHFALHPPVITGVQKSEIFASVFDAGRL